jgi:hypothetical protein
MIYSREGPNPLPVVPGNRRCNRDSYVLSVPASRVWRPGDDWALFPMFQAQGDPRQSVQLVDLLVIDLPAPALEQDGETPRPLAHLALCEGLSPL